MPERGLAVEGETARAGIPALRLAQRIVPIGPDGDDHEHAAGQQADDAQAATAPTSRISQTQSLERNQRPAPAPSRDAEQHVAEAQGSDQQQRPGPEERPGHGLTVPAAHEQQQNGCTDECHDGHQNAESAARTRRVVLFHAAGHQLAGGNRHVLSQSDPDREQSHTADGNWTTDTVHADSYVDDGFGGKNSVVRVDSRFPAVEVKLGDGTISGAGIEHSQSSTAVNNMGGGRVEITFRSHRGDIQGMDLLIHEGSAERTLAMAPAGQDGAFEYWRGTVTAGAETTSTTWPPTRTRRRSNT